MPKLAEPNGLCSQSPAGKRRKTWRYRALGLTLVSQFPLPGMRAVEDHAEAAVSIRLCDRAEIERSWPGAEPGAAWTTRFSDGCLFRAERARTGARRFTYDGRTVYLLSADARTVLCAPSGPAELDWQRVLLDSVLLAATLLHGLEALHASAVAGPGGVVGFVTDSGGGKSSLAAELVRRGSSFFSDDILALEGTAGGIRAHPGPPVMNFPLDPGRFSPNEIGSVLDTFGNEAWVSVRDAAFAPQPLAAICLVERREGIGFGLDRLHESPLHLLPHAIGFGPPPERLAHRFQLLGDVATTVPVYRLRADPRTEPALLADLVESRLLAATGSAPD